MDAVFTCKVCRKQCPPGRKLYCSQSCMYVRGNRTARIKRWKKNSRVARCRGCGAQWTSLRAGPLPTLCPGCGEESRYCATCETVKPLSSFHRNGRQGRNQTCGSCHAEYMRKPSVKETQRWYKILRNYGLTREDYESMSLRQEGRCAICLEVPSLLAVDHCHETGRVRALLCRKCNTAIGAFGDNVDKLRQAIDYLVAHGS
jgi:hypothetical protein